MLTVIEGGFNSGTLDEIRNRILSSLKHGRRSLLIVPEQQTVIAEADMANFLPSNAPLLFEVTNFTRLADTAFRALGGLAGEYCDSVKKRLFIFKAMSELSPLLSVTGGRSEISVGAVNRMLSAISEMQALGIGADELDELSKSCDLADKPRLKAKIADLSLVMAKYKKLVNEKYNDSADDIDTMIKKLCENPLFLSDTDIFIDGFTSFTEGQYRLIGMLCERTSVSVSLTIPKAMPDALEYSECAAAKERLYHECDRRSVTKKLVRLDGAKGILNPLIKDLTDNIWRYNAKIDNNYLQNNGSVRIFASKTPYEMCDFVAADIKRRVFHGEKYSDFAIVARQADAYTGLLDLSLKKYGISAFMSAGTDAESFSAIKLIYSAYAAINSGFERQFVISYMKSGLVPIPTDMLDELELYINKWQLTKSRFTDGLFWNMSPRGYDNRQPADMPAILERINRTKDLLISPLVKLSENVKAAKTAKEHAMCLVSFLTEIELDKTIEERAEFLLKAGQASEAYEYRRLWQTICASLDTLEKTVGDMKTTPESFILQLKIVFLGIEVTKIPAYIDEVTVGSADMLRLYGKRHIYLIGVNDGEFPSSAPDSSYLSERDREILSSISPVIKPERQERAARELFFFVRAMSYARESLTFAYYESNTDFKKARPSAAISAIERLLGENANVKKTYELPPDDKIWTYDSLAEAVGRLNTKDYAPLAEAMRSMGYESVLKAREGSIDNSSLSLSPELSDEMYGQRLSMSQSRLDTYVGCPLNYFCKYNLSLREDSPAEFGANNTGSFVHAILESFFRKIRKNRMSVSEITKQERINLTKRAAYDYIRSLGDGIKEGGERMKLRIERLCRAAEPVVDGLCDEFSNSKFVPMFFELPIGDGSPDSPSAPIIKSESGDEVAIYGAIDRVDGLKVDKDLYIRVVDYKTGKKEFSPSDIKKGENLQMFLYLKAICDTKSESFRSSVGVDEDGEILPAGVIYASTSIDDVKVRSYDDKLAEDEVKKNQKRQGMLIDDESIIRSMNTDFIPIKFKNGEIDEKSRELLFSLDGWADIMKDVETAVLDITKKIRSGNIAATPSISKNGQKKCEWCEFKPFCRRVVY